MRRVVTGKDAEGKPIYKCEPDTVMPDSGVVCARDEKGVPVSRAGKLLEQAAKPAGSDTESAAAPTEGAATMNAGPTPRRGRHHQE